MVKPKGLNCPKPTSLNCSSKSLQPFKYYDTKFYNYFFHKSIYSTTEKASFFCLVNLKHLKSIPLNQTVHDLTYLLTFEINLYNKETEVWTILKASAENHDYDRVKTRLNIINLKNDLVSARPGVLNSIRLHHIVFFLMISLYIVHEGCQLKNGVEQYGIVSGFVFYIWSFENILDTILLLFSSLYLTTIAYNELFLVGINSNFLNINTEFLSLYHAYNLEKNLQLECNLIIFTAFLKALNLLKFNPKTYLITDTLSTGFFDLMFLILFVLSNYIMMGFIGYIFFRKDPQFSTLGTAIITSIVSIVKHIDFDLLIEEKFAWLCTWQIFVWFYVQKILISFVISVIIAYFNQVRVNHQATDTEKTFSRIIQNGLEYFHFSARKKSLKGE